MQIFLKTFIFPPLFFLILSSRSFGFVTPIHSLVKDEIVKQTSKIFKREVSVGSVSGYLINSVVLRDIKIAKNKKLSDGSIIYIKEAKIKYDTVKAGIKKDIIPAISEIEVIDPIVFVEHYKNGDWNLLKLIEGDNTSAPPPPFLAKVVVVNGRVRFIDHLNIQNKPLAKKIEEEASRINGLINLTQKNKIYFKSSANVNNFPVYAEGKIDLKKRTSEIKVAARNISLKKWNSYIGIPVVKEVDMDGKAEIDIKAEISSQKLLEGKINISDAKIYGRSANGLLTVSLLGDKINVDIAKGSFCSGKISAKLFVDISQKSPALNGRISFSKIDLRSLSKNLFETSGTTDGIINISGTPQDAKILGEFDAQDSVLLGERFDKIIVDSNTNTKGVTFNLIEILNNNTKITANGDLDKNFMLHLDFASDGFDLNRANLISGISGKLDKLSGNFDAKIDKIFLRKPLENMSTKIKVELRNAKIWEQEISAISADAEIDKGNINIKNISAYKNSSKIKLKGNLSSGLNANLEILTDGAYLEDFDIINRFLPHDLRGISGHLNAKLSLSGRLNFRKGDFFDLIAPLTAKAEMSIRDGSIAGRSIKNGDFKLSLKNKALSLEKCQISSDHSKLSINGKIDENHNIKMPFDLKLDIADLQPITQKYAKISGKSSIKGSISGGLENPKVFIDFSATDLSYNDILLDALSGKIKYIDNVLYLQGPAKLLLGNDDYLIDSNISLFENPPSFEIKFYSKSGGLGSISQIAQMIYLEIVKRRGSFGKAPKDVVLNLTPLNIPKISSLKSSLSRWEKVKNDYEAFKLSYHPFKIMAEGKIGLYIDLKMKNGKINAKADLYSKNKCRIGKYVFNDLLFSGEIKDSVLFLNNFSFKKGSGIFSAYGSSDFKEKNDFTINAKEISIDAIDTAFNFGMPLKGILNLDSRVSGSLKSPNIASEFYVSQGEIKDIYLDGVNGKAEFADNILEIENFNIFSGKQRASLKGSIPFNQRNNINIKADLDGENAGLLLSLFKGIRWLKGEGKASVAVKGKINDPKIYGYVKLKKSEVNISQLKSNAHELDIDISVDNNKIYVRQFSGYLKGALSKEKNLPFSISGSIDFRDALIKKKIITLDLNASDILGSLDIANFYSGDFSASGLSFKGALSINPAENHPSLPLLSGNVILYDGRISIPKAGNQNKQKSILPFEMNISGSLGRNLYFFQGEESFLSAELSKMDALMSAENIRITGPITAPQIVGDVNINSGSVGILGRDFELMTSDLQEKFFLNDRNLVERNTAVFKGGSGKRAIMPDLSITAKSEVSVEEEITKKEDSEKEKAAPQKEKVIVITKISGAMFVEEKPIILKFFAFKEDKTASPPKYDLMALSENEIRIMLLPDFVKSTLGLSKGGQPVEMNAIIVDYLNSRLQSYLIKGLTTNVEKILGLESFSLEYNFGRDLEKYLPTTRDETTRDDRSQIAVGFAKGFFDRIYIQLKYAQATSQASIVNSTAINYQITWKINKNYSVVYYREPITFQDQNSTYYKMTLQSLYKF